jgi:hypothetical protein
MNGRVTYKSGSFRVEYSYRGDRLTDPRLKGQVCRAIRKNGKCIRGRNSNMLVEFNGEPVVVLARQLRKIHGRG